MDAAGTSWLSAATTLAGGPRNRFGGRTAAVRRAGAAAGDAPSMRWMRARVSPRDLPADLAPSEALGARAPRPMR
jgi:hypothetical protein